VTVWPEKVGRVPWLPLRIRVEVVPRGQAAGVKLPGRGATLAAR
jgi:hypothetical protein